MKELHVGKVYEVREQWRVLYADDLEVVLRRPYDGHTIILSRGQWENEARQLTESE